MHRDSEFYPWNELADGRWNALLELASSMDDLRRPAAIARLRAEAPETVVAAAIELLTARKKATEKFPRADSLLADALGIEQATSADIAQHKAQRFADAGCSQIVDLCCGIGGDAMALRHITRVSCFDLQPHRAFMAHANTGCFAAVADVQTLRLAAVPYHIDPDRRAGGRRRWRLADAQPGPAFLHSLGRGDGAMKLSPGVEFSELPAGEVELISRRGTAVQAVLWTGRLRRHERTATQIDAKISIHGCPGSTIPIAPPARFVHEIDPAVERADLIGELCRHEDLPAIHPQLGLLTGDQPSGSPWLTSFELLEQMPMRAKRVKQWLAAHDGGIVEVKIRGGSADADALQKAWRGTGSVSYAVFVLRFGQQVRVLITRRVVSTSP